MGKRLVVEMQDSATGDRHRFYPRWPAVAPAGSSVGDEFEVEGRLHRVVEVTADTVVVRPSGRT